MTVVLVNFLKSDDVRVVYKQSSIPFWCVPRWINELKEPLRPPLKRYLVARGLAFSSGQQAHYQVLTYSSQLWGLPIRAVVCANNNEPGTFTFQHICCLGIV